MKQGPGTTRVISPRTATPVAGFHLPVSHLPRPEGLHSDDGDNDYDGEMSVTGTELGSDTNSLGSLTSVE